MIKKSLRLNLAQKLIQTHLVEGAMLAGEELGLKIDQTLTQDATGTLVMLELEAMGLNRVKTELSVQYVDHNLAQEDYKNADDHLFLESACRRFGIWFSRPGNGVSHPVHMQHFGKPGKTLLGSDSHSCAGGSLGMLAIGAGGLEVAMAMAGHPFYIKMPKIFGIKLKKHLPNWVAAKDIILELLRRHTVKGAVNCILEYYGPGLTGLSAMDRHVIANMGAELGATASIFPSDENTQAFLTAYGRQKDWIPLTADKGSTYDLHDEIDLSRLVPLIALPSSPDKVVPVRKVTGKVIYQSYIGSSANPGFLDFAIAAYIVKGKKIADGVSLDINPSSRDSLEDLIQSGHLKDLVHAGARIHQTGCNGCIGMGQAPATGKNSLRTVPRNFPGRSGTLEDSIFLCSPATAAASALRGAITDPRDLKLPYPKLNSPKHPVSNFKLFQKPLPLRSAKKVNLLKGPNIISLPEVAPCPDAIHLPILLKLGNHISTDEIMPAGSRVLPYRSNIPKISEFCFDIVDPTYFSRAKRTGSHIIISGENYGQGSSREHAALAPRYLGLQIVIAKSFARIHWQNLINFGILPLTFSERDDYETLAQGDFLAIKNMRDQLYAEKAVIKAEIGDKNKILLLRHQLSARQIKIFLLGGLTSWIKQFAH